MAGDAKMRRRREAQILKGEDIVKRGLSSVQVPVSDVKRGLSSVQGPVSDQKRGLSSVQVPFGDVKRGPSSVQVSRGRCEEKPEFVQVPVSDEGYVPRLLLLRRVLLPLHPLRPRAPHLLLLHSIWNWFPRFEQFRIEKGSFR